MKLEEIIKKFNELYPESYKASYDNVGLMVGRMNKDVKRVLLALDLTRDVMDEAIENKVDLIITHHPILFRPLYLIDTEKDPGSIIRDLIKYDISNYAMHTNFDSCKMNDYLSDLLKITDKEVLSARENCGVYGNIEKTSLKDYISFVKDVFHISSCEYYGKQNIEIKRVAVCGGSGSSFFNDCMNKDIDLYITGDVNYSRGLEAKRMGLNVLDVGHFVEALYVNVVEKDLKEMNSDIEVLKSEVNVVPYVRY